MAFVVFLTIDQAHWWRLKPDYAFGWLVPVFAIYVVSDRWGTIRELMQTSEPDRMPRWRQLLLGFAFGAVLTLGLLLFSIGAVYRAGTGSSQPGSLVLAVGFSGLFLGMVYFNTPPNAAGSGSRSGLWSSLRSDLRLRVVSLFLFPALIWILSAPLLTAVENAISLVMLNRVVAVVFTTFSLLGYPLVQEGNVLVLPTGTVGVAEACSGIRSLTGCLFAGTFLAAILLDRLWKKVALIAAALALAFFTNLLRSLFLTAWAYAYGSEAIEGSLHDMTGYAVLGLTVIGLLLLLPFFDSNNWKRWLGSGSDGETFVKS